MDVSLDVERIENIWELKESDLFIFLMKDVFYEIFFCLIVKLFLENLLMRNLIFLMFLVIYV